MKDRNGQDSLSQVSFSFLPVQLLLTKTRLIAFSKTLCEN